MISLRKIIRFQSRVFLTIMGQCYTDFSALKIAYSVASKQFKHQPLPCFHNCNSALSTFGRGLREATVLIFGRQLKHFNDSRLLLKSSALCALWKEERTVIIQPNYLALNNSEAFKYQLLFHNDLSKVLHCALKYEPYTMSIVMYIHSEALASQCPH